MKKIMKKKQFQISEELLVNLVKFHLFDIQDEILQEQIRIELEAKFERIKAREDYRKKLENNTGL